MAFSCLQSVDSAMKTVGFGFREHDFARYHDAAAAADEEEEEDGGCDDDDV